MFLRNMWKFAVLLICLNGYCLAGPVGPKRNKPIVQQRYEDAPIPETEEPAANLDPNEMMIMSSLSLPSNATSIRADITDRFSCENKTYGYYADVDNDCQIFHVCLPVTYADGKENTFRWSFICPEETIFSQDSFTCMRPDDMTISCEESYQYYELNRNFGIVDTAGDKESSNEAAAATADISEAVAEAEVEAEVTKPVVQEEEEKAIGQYKPVNVIKPSRRKPSTSYNPQRRPINSYPLRKMPQTHTPTQMVTENSEDSSDNTKPVEKEEEEEIKPAVLKFSRRPVPVVSNSFKDKIQSTKTENVVSTRTELFNQMRKRPTLFDKKPAEQPEAAEAEQEKEEKVQQPKIELEQKQHNFSPIPSDMQIASTNTEIEASESNHAFVKPEETNETPQNAAAAVEPVQILEAFEEIPAVVSEVVASPSADEEETNNEETLTLANEKSNAADEPQITEEVHSGEEIQSDEDMEVLKEAQPDQKTADAMQSSVNTQIAESEIANEAETAQETQPEAAKEIVEVQQSLRTSAEENPTVEESKTEEVKKTDGNSEETESSNAAEDTKTVAEAEMPAAIQVLEETQMAEASEIPEEIKTVEESHTTMESQASKDAAVVAVETQTAEQTQAAEETPAAEQMLAAEETQAVEQTQAAEEEIPEAHQNLRTSVEEMQSSEQAEPAAEQPISQTGEEMPASEETEAANEKFQSAEVTQEDPAVPIDDEIKTAEETQATQDVQKNEDSHKLEDNISNAQTQQDEAPINNPEGLVVEESLPVVHEIEEPQISDEPVAVEDSKPVEEDVLATKVDDLVKSEYSNSEEGVNNEVSVETIEQMESEKPADVPELMQSTEEMSHPDAMTQNMYENMDMGKKTVGGFKPVDPVMAHEAEQLIVDFINTLRKNDFTNETPGLHTEQQMNEVSEEAESDKNAPAEDIEKVESSEQTQEVIAKFEEPENKDDIEMEISDSQADAVEDDKEESPEIHDVEEYKQETEEVNEYNNLKSLESQSLENMKESQEPEESAAQAMNLPQEMYQIPVQVLHTPVEEMPVEEEQPHESESASSDTATNTEERLAEESPAMTMAGHKALSIDDIVELVKERLDHMPKNEMDTPMKLEEVIGEAPEDKAHQEEKLEEQTPLQKEEQHHASHSEEEIVMPIYQRTVQPIQVDAAVQTADLEQIENEEQSEASDSAADVSEKTYRSYRSRSVSTPKKDSRKRHFLFKADSS